MWDFRVPSVSQHRGLERRREARVCALSFKTETSHSGAVCKCEGVGSVQMSVGVRRQLTGSLLLPCGFQEMNSTWSTH